MAYGNKPITYPKNHRLLDTKLYREVQDFLDGKTGMGSVTRRVLEDVFKVPFRKSGKSRKRPRA